MVDIKEEPKIAEGKKVLELLDKSKFKPSSFFWFYMPDSNSWRLIISSSEFDSKESKEYYSTFVENFRKEELIKTIGLENITLLPTTNNLIKLLKFAIKTGPDSISGIRFTSNTINNVFIADAYIYRIS